MSTRMRVKYFLQLVLVFFLGTSLLLPLKASAISVNDLYEGLKNVYSSTSTTISNNINKLKSPFLNNNTAETKSKKTTIRRAFKKTYSEASLKLNNYQMKINNKLNKYKIPILRNTAGDSSQLLVVKKADAPKVENWINSLSSKQYVVDKKGNVKSVYGVPEDLNKSSEYSTVLDNLIKGNCKTRILTVKKEGSDTWMQLPLLGSLVIISDKPSTSGNITLNPNTALSHELIHSFRWNKGLFNIDVAHEEACTIKLENIIRFKNGLQLRNDGSILDDVNKDGKPDGDGRYGVYANKSEQNWFEEFLEKIK